MHYSVFACGRSTFYAEIYDDMGTEVACTGACPTVDAATEAAKQWIVNLLH